MGNYGKISDVINIFETEFTSTCSHVHKLLNQLVLQDEKWELSNVKTLVSSVFSF